MAYNKWVDIFTANPPSQIELSSKSGMSAYYDRMIEMYPTESRSNLSKQWSNYKHIVFSSKTPKIIPAIPVPVSTTQAPETDIKPPLKKHLKPNSRYTVEELSNKFNCTPLKIRAIIDEFIQEGHSIQIDGINIITSTQLAKSEAHFLDVKKMSTGFYKFGYVTDNHLCSKYERLDVLNAMYQLFKEEGITKVFNTGNYIDGEARFNKNEIHTHGFDKQIDYCVKNYPQVEGIETEFIDGDDHEGWYLQREGIIPGQKLEMMARDMGRNDLKYLGYMEADVIIAAPNGQTKIRLLHPGGGSSYAVSYTAQKIVESYTGGEKPDILLVGHYHKAEYLYNRGVHIIQGGCTTDQSPFMRKKRLAAHLGGWIFEFSTDDNGAITRFKQELIPFYDNAYYKRWKYIH